MVHLRNVLELGSRGACNASGFKVIHSEIVDKGVALIPTRKLSVFLHDLWCFIAKDIKEEILK
jgi:hypothetical protein